MSAPISSFSRLSISQEMQGTRGHARAQSGGKGKGKAKANEPLPPDNDPEFGSDNESDGDFWNGHVIALDHCRQHHSAHTGGSYYAFQMAFAQVERYSIRISSTSAGVPSCSCDEVGICHHVAWLMEQTSRTREDVKAGVPNVYQHISDVGLENICEDLDWELREGMESEETKWQLTKDFQTSRPTRRTRSMIRARTNVVRDIMAALSPDVTEDYRPDIFNSLEDISDGKIVVEGDLEATIARLLILDDVFFFKFRSLVSRNLRATEHFRKMGQKALEAFRLLEQYEESGPTAGKEHDLAWCAQALVDIVDNISANVTMRQPLNPSSREEAAKSLVTILKDVVRKNYDIYQTVKWPRRRPHGELQIDRNLYERLIGSTSRSNPSGGNFVIKALQDLPEAQRFVDDLQEILDILETIGWGPAPQAYRDRLKALIAQLKGVPATSSSVKRPASAMEGKAKRMK